MKVWTIQPAYILDEINRTGEFICDINKSLNINNGVDQPAKGIFLPFNNTTNKKAHVIYNDNNNILNIHAVEDYMDFGNPISSKINISVEDIQLNGKLKIINALNKLSAVGRSALYIPTMASIGKSKIKEKAG